MNLSSARTKKAAPLFAALGDPVRLAFVMQLSRCGPLATLSLQESTALTRQAVTKHLQLLERAGLVQSKRHGRDRVWQLEVKRLAEVRRYLDEISTQWDAAIGRLQAFLEEN